MKNTLVLFAIASIVISMFSVFVPSSKACPLFVQENAVFMSNMDVVPIGHSFANCPEASPMPILEIGSSEESYQLNISFYVNDSSVAAFVKVIYCNNATVYRDAIPSSMLKIGWNTLTVTLPRPNEGEIHGVRIVGVAGHRDDDGVEPWIGVSDESFGANDQDWNLNFGDGYFVGKTAEDLDWYEYEVAYQFTLKTPGLPGHNPFIGSLTITPSKTTLAPGESFTVTAKYYRYSYCPSDYFKLLYAEPLKYTVYATRLGMVGHTTANGHVIQPHDHFVALPSRKALSSLDGHEYEVRITYRGKSVVAPVWDVGPWNTKDDYWNPSSEREMWKDLPQGMPEAQAAYERNYNGGFDEYIYLAGIDRTDFGVGDRVRVIATELRVRETAGGNVIGLVRAGDTGTVLSGPQRARNVDDGLDYRWWEIRWDNGLQGWSADRRYVLNPAGIDLADGVFEDLGMTSNDWVTVEFLWTAKNIKEAGRWAAGYWQMVPYGWQTFTLTLTAPSTAGMYTLKAVGCSGHGTYNYFGVNWDDPRYDGGFCGHRPEELDWNFYEIYATSSINVNVYTVSVTIVEVRAIDTMDPVGPWSAADFYAKVSIDGVDFSSQVRSNDDDIYPEWTFSRTVSKTIVPIHIEIWDSDSPLSDDHVDINRNSNHNDLDLLFDAATQSLTGDVTFGYSRGGGGDGNRAEIWFNVGLDNGDRDGDGLFDSWEINGIHMNDDGIVDLNLPALGANPDHKDIFVEIDWMEDATHSHRPMAGVSQAVINAFANAPVTNPDGTSGINLHIDESNSVPHQNELAIWAGFDAIKAANFDPNRRFVYHYCLFIHNIQGLDGTSGIAEFPGNDFVVSLGSWTGGVGTIQQQEGTLMHELGHNLNLGHGGGDHINYKPNYLSIMNYFFQMSGIPPTGRLDYSRNALPNLDENSLNENIGIQDGTDNTNYYSPTGTILVGQGTGPIDWDADGIIETNVQADINRDGRRTVLTGYNDWANILYNARGRSDFEDGIHITSELLTELDIATYESMKRESVEKFAEGPQAIPLYTKINWTLYYIMTNVHDFEIYNITVKDYFGANLDVTLVSLTKGTYLQSTNKARRQQRFEWSINELKPYETVVLKLQVSTGKNPAGNQEYTTAGLCILNSGATAKWFNATGKMDSATTSQISVWAGVTVSDTNGAIAGYVYNGRTGDPLSGCTVELRNADGTVIISVVTDKNGFYSFSMLTPGEYIVTSMGQSYTVTVTAEQVTEVDFKSN